jgi:hypothetical protein
MRRPGPTSVLTLQGQATFRSFKSSPLEIRMQLRGDWPITIVQVSKKRFRAEWTGGRPLVSMLGDLIDGNLYTVKRQIGERFEKQVTPWKWTRNGVEVAEPTENEIY